MKTSEEPIIVEATFSAPPERVWQAITDPEEMRQWYFKQIEDFRPEPGFESKFTVALEERSFEHLWKIVEVEEGRSISYTWRYTEYPGNSHVSMQLSPAGAGSHFRLEDVVTEDFPDGIPEFEREAGVEGWNYLIKEALKAHLDS